MTNRYVLGLVSLALFTACGKGMQMTTAENTAGVDKTIPRSKILLNSTQTLDGGLQPLSKFDFKTLEVPFLDLGKDGKVSAETIREVGKPNFITDAEAEGEGFVKNSNLVFRAIKKIPPAAAVKNVEKLTLTLKGVRVFSVTGEKLEDTLKKQVLCMLDSKKCTFSLGLNDKNNLNAKFQPEGESMSLADARLFDAGIQTRDASGSLYTYKGTTEIPSLVIDLKKAFGLKDADAAQWLVENSTIFDTTGNYRKFKFVLGNNVYASSGTLDVVLTKDSAKLPGNFGAIAGTAVNPDDAQGEEVPDGTVLEDAKTEFSEAKVRQVLENSSVGFDGATARLTDESVKRLQALAKVINNHDCEIKTVFLSYELLETSEVECADSLGKARAQSIKEILLAADVKNEIVVSSQAAAKTSLDLRISLVTSLSAENTVTDAKAISDGVKSTLLDGVEAK